MYFSSRSNFATGYLTLRDQRLLFTVCSGRVGEELLRFPAENRRIGEFLDPFHLRLGNMLCHHLDKHPYRISNYSPIQI